MDDCNAIAGQLVLVVANVQIPLWTIVTGGDAFGVKIANEFRFLYGRL